MEAFNENLLRKTEDLARRKRREPNVRKGVDDSPSFIVRERQQWVEKMVYRGGRGSCMDDE
jgi:hypothetical protein